MPEIIDPRIIEPNVEEITPGERRGYLAALQRAYWTGVDYVSYNGDQTKFRSRLDMKMMIRELQMELGSIKRRSRVTYARMPRK
ncbi:hypothetical protein FLP41_15175 [Paracoccus marcusii]|uniref:phage head-tail joining protein n=1 Tax=Paracoccus marcusii TaxID=59779 RepID=UPI0012EF31E9|nr:hypothetical protein FLP41_15175 [Paracoccus marcusii]